MQAEAVDVSVIGCDALHACCVARQPAPGCARRQRSRPTPPVCGGTAKQRTQARQRTAWQLL